MLTFAITSIDEWNNVKKIYQVDDNLINETPYGEYFITKINHTDCLFYRGQVKKYPKIDTTIVEEQTVRFELIDKYEIFKNESLTIFVNENDN